MYIPKHFSNENLADALTFMQRFNFASLISYQNGRPTATHLPFVISKNQNKIVLHSHLALNNPQWKNMEEQEVMVIFSEPHAYISPTSYDKKESVPTWDYIAVHAYGRVRIIEDSDGKRRTLEQMIDTFEPTYRQQWAELSEKYKEQMQKAIVVFEIDITECQFQEKLSQNKKEHERHKIKETLSKGSATEKELAKYIPVDDKH